MTGRIGMFVTLALGLLLLAVGSQYFAKLDDQAMPSLNSVRPSGSAVFAELLRQEGYKVRVDRSLEPKVQPGEVAIVFQKSTDEFDFFQQSVDSRALDAQRALKVQVEKGAGAVYLPLTRSFPQAVKIAEGKVTAVERSTDGTARKLSINPNGTPTEEGTSQPLYANAEGDYVSVSKRGKGLAVSFGDGIVATNRLIDNSDNAKVLLEAVRIAGDKKSVVFTEATFNPNTPGLLEVLGPWAQGFVYQTLFVIVIAIATLGKRFGLEDILVRSVKSTRDVADAISDTMRRGRMAGTALGVILEDQERRTGIKPSSEARNAIGHPQITADEALRIAKKTL
ncbi:hypothetical protein EON81_02170 [bacterium]|nr:MAG: hypothetical protein EON81_02170 [bacterium]